MKYLLYALFIAVVAYAAFEVIVAVARSSAHAVSVATTHSDLTSFQYYCVAESMVTNNGHVFFVVRTQRSVAVCEVTDASKVHED
jgi:tRNA1(Val) A37 N6-methylase TrmN6